jgi:hypothetical protein
MRSTSRRPGPLGVILTVSLVLGATSCGDTSGDDVSVITFTVPDSMVPFEAIEEFSKLAGGFIRVSLPDAWQVPQFDTTSGPSEPWDGEVHVDDLATIESPSALAKVTVLRETHTTGVPSRADWSDLAFAAVAANGIALGEVSPSVVDGVDGFRSFGRSSDTSFHVRTFAVGDERIIVVAAISDASRSTDSRAAVAVFESVVGDAEYLASS